MQETDAPNHHMDGPTAARLLSQILKWRCQPWTPTTQVKATRYDTDKISQSAPTVLPFGLDTVIEAVESDGALGVTNYESVDKWLRFWNPWVSYWASLPQIYREQPGATYCEALETNPVFTNVDNWDEDDQNAWDDFTSELKTVHTIVARATGHQPQTRGLCPICREGTLKQATGKNGFTDEAVCSNQQCGTSLNYAAGETAASIRATLRSTDIAENIFLPVSAIRTIWGSMVKSSTLRKWVQRDRVRKHGDLYNLADVNRAKANQQCAR